MILLNGYKKANYGNFQCEYRGQLAIPKNRREPCSKAKAYHSDWRGRPTKKISFCGGGGKGRWQKFYFHSTCGGWSGSYFCWLLLEVRMSRRWTEDDVKRVQEKRAVATSVERTQALGRMKAGTMNKTETRYAQHLDWLKLTRKIQWYAFEPANLRLGAKCYYTIDFLVLTAEGILEVHEVKGYWTDDAKVKIKVAAEKFPFVFKSVKEVDGEWEYKHY